MENANISYTIRSGVHTLSANFSINPTDGKLVPKAPIDYESLLSPPYVHLVVIATDNGYPRRSTSVNVTIIVQVRYHTYGFIVSLFGICLYVADSLIPMLFDQKG